MSNHMEVNQDLIMALYIHASILEMESKNYVHGISLSQEPTKCAYNLQELA